MRFNVKGNKLIGHTCYFCSQLLQLPSRRSFPKCSQSCLGHRNRSPFWCFPHSRVRSRECRSRMSRKSRLTSRRKTTGWSHFRRRRMSRRYCCIRRKIPMTIRIRYFQTTTDHFRRPHQTWKRCLERNLLEACSRAKRMKSPFHRHPCLAAHQTGILNTLLKCHHTNQCLMQKSRFLPKDHQSSLLLEFRYGPS